MANKFLIILVSVEKFESAILQGKKKKHLIVKKKDFYNFAGLDTNLLNLTHDYKPLFDFCWIYTVASRSYYFN